MVTSGDALYGGPGSYNASDQFDTLRQIIHRRPSLRSGKPSIIRHRAWWFEGNIDDAHENLEAIYDDLCKLFSMTFQRQIVHTDIPVISRDGSRFVRKFAVFDGICMSAYQRYSISLHDERVTLTQIVDVGYQRLAENAIDERTRERLDTFVKADRQTFVKTGSLHSSSEVHFSKSPESNELTVAQRCYRAFDHVMTNARELLFEISKESRARSNIMKSEDLRSYSLPKKVATRYYSEMQPQARELFNDIWGKVDALFLSFAGVHGVSSSVAAGLPPTKVKLFADFRGVLLPSSLRWEGYDKFQQFLEVRSYAPAEGWKAVIKAIWPLLRSVESLEDADSLSNKDVVACSLRNAGGAYLSTVGSSHYSAPLARAEATPIKYILASNLSSRWENGRLVDDINRLGTYRLMAFRDYEKLRESGEHVRKSGAKLDEIAQRMPAANSDEKKKIRQEISREFEEMQRYPTTHGGVYYRIYRSTTYADAFRRLLENIQCAPVDGYRDYREMMERQAEGVFDYIDSLGKRARALSARFVAIIELQEMEQATETQMERNRLIRAGEKFETIAYSYYIGYALMILFTGGYLLLAETRADHSVSEAEKYIAQGVIAVVVFVTVFASFLYGRRFVKWLRDKKKIANKDAEVETTVS